MRKKDSRWNDTSSVEIISHVTKKEKKEAIEKMVENFKKNSYEQKGKDQK